MINYWPQLLTVCYSMCWQCYRCPYAGCGNTVPLRMEDLEENLTLKDYIQKTKPTWRRSVIAEQQRLLHCYSHPASQIARLWHLRRRSPGALWPRHLYIDRGKGRCCQADTSVVLHDKCFNVWLVIGTNWIRSGKTWAKHRVLLSLLSLHILNLIQIQNRDLLWTLCGIYFVTFVDYL